MHYNIFLSREDAHIQTKLEALLVHCGVDHAVIVKPGEPTRVVMFNSADPVLLMIEQVIAQMLGTGAL